MLPLIPFLCASLFVIHVHASKDQENASTLHSLDLLSRSIAHPYRRNYESVGLLVEHAEMQRIIKRFLPNTQHLEGLEHPVRSDIIPYKIYDTPFCEESVYVVRKTGRRTINFKCHQQFYLRLPPWQAGAYQGDIYRVIFRDPIDFGALKGRLEKRSARMSLPLPPLLPAPSPALSLNPSTLHLPIARSYHPYEWDIGHHKYRHVFSFLILSLQQDESIACPRTKFKIFLGIARALLPGIRLDVLIQRRKESDRHAQFAVNPMQRMDTGDDLIYSPLQRAYQPYRMKPAIVLARTPATDTKDHLQMLILELPEYSSPVARFTREQKMGLQSLHHRMVVRASRDEVEGMIIRAGEDLFTQQYLQQHYT